MIDFGKIAYEAYRKFSEGKSLVSGMEIPDWEALPPVIRQAWEAAGRAVADVL